MTETTTLRGALVMSYPSALGPADEPLTIEWPEGHSYAARVDAVQLHEPHRLVSPQFVRRTVPQSATHEREVGVGVTRFGGALLVGEVRRLSSSWM